MIDAKELRIGNWVNDPVLGNVMVYGVSTVAYLIKKYDSFHYSINYEIINPIPLTKEILEKCGFKRSMFNNEFEWSLKTDLCKNSSFDFNETISGEYYFWTVIKVAEIKYLHQLQNLYYALTQTELKIEL